METMFYSGFNGQACRVLYGVAPRFRCNHQGADIIIIHTPKLGPVTSLVVSDEARNSVLNRILATAFPGIRLDLIRFFVVFDDAVTENANAQGYEFPIALDFDDYKKKGNRVLVDYPVPKSWTGRMLWRLGFRSRRESVWNKDVLAGSARYYTPIEKLRHLEFDELKALCQSVGYRPVGQSLPEWLIALGSVLPLRDNSSKPQRPH